MIELHTWSAAIESVNRRDAALLLESTSKVGKKVWHLLPFEKDGTANISFILTDARSSFLDIIWTERSGWVVDIESHTRYLEHCSMREHMKKHDRVDWTKTRTPDDLIRLVDPDVLVTFSRMGRSYPCVTIYAADGGMYLLDVLSFFQARTPHEAAIKKMTMVPFVQKYIAEHKIDVRGYVFVCDGWSADSTDRKTRRERVHGVPVGKMTNRVPVVLYAAEMYDDAREIHRAFAEREIQERPERKLLDLEIGEWAEGTLVNKIGFGVLNNNKESRDVSR